MTQPPYNPQPQPQPGQGQYGQSQLVVNLRKPFGWLSEHMITPTVRINGHPATARWGQNFYPTHPGHHQIECSQTYMWSFGAQSMAVDIPPGQSVEVHYTGPVVTFGAAGLMGFEQQPRPGMVAFGLLIGIPIAIVLLLVIVGIVAGLSS